MNDLIKAAEDACKDLEEVLYDESGNVEIDEDTGCELERIMLVLKSAIDKAKQSGFGVLSREKPLDCVGVDPEKQSTGKADSRMDSMPMYTRPGIPED